MVFLCAQKKNDLCNPCPICPFTGQATDIPRPPPPTQALLRGFSPSTTTCSRLAASSAAPTNRYRRAEKTVLVLKKKQECRTCKRTCAKVAHYDESTTRAPQKQSHVGRQQKANNLRCLSSPPPPHPRPSWRSFACCCQRAFHNTSQ